MEQMKHFVDVFSDYLNTTTYYEIVYSRVLNRYVSLVYSDDVYTVLDTYEELSNHILGEFLGDIIYSAEFEEERNEDRVSPGVVKAFWERLAPYIEKLPEIKSIAERVIEKNTKATAEEIDD